MRKIYPERYLEDMKQWSYLDVVPRYKDPQRKNKARLTRIHSIEYRRHSTPLIYMDTYQIQSKHNSSLL